MPNLLRNAKKLTDVITDFVLVLVLKINIHSWLVCQTQNYHMNNINRYNTKNSCTLYNRRKK